MISTYDLSVTRFESGRWAEHTMEGGGGGASKGFQRIKKFRIRIP